MRIIIYFIALVVIFILKTACYANPIPIFELFGWIEDKNATINEYDENGCPGRIKRYSF